jgi:hypothetical protein
VPVGAKLAGGRLLLLGQPSLAAVGRGGGQSVPGALADEVPLELGERGQDGEEQLALPESYMMALYSGGRGSL